MVLFGIAAAVGGGPEAGGPEPQATEAIVKAPVSEVWNAFATPEGFKKLGVAQCEMDFRIGGLIRTHYDPKGRIGDDGTIQNEIISFDPGRMLSIRIHQPPKAFPFSEETWKSTWTVITLTDLGDGRTHVRIAALGYPDTEEGRKMRQFFLTGNAWVLEKLQHAFDAAASAPTGPAHKASPLDPIVLERTIELPRSDVWNLLSTSAGWKRFFGVESTIELKPGGRFEILFGNTAPAGQRGSEGCTVLSFVPEELLSYTWNAPPKLAYARTKRSWVVIRLDAISPGRTRVRMNHQGFAELAAESPDHEAEFEEVRGYFEKAWPKVLDALQKQGTSR
jgi:uncharacterized protein YndB with AHSA1/START domain